MKEEKSSNKFCGFCKEHEATTNFEIYQGSKITNYVIVAATITKEYLMIPSCEVCYEELQKTKVYNTIIGILLVIFAIFLFAIVFTIIAKFNEGRVIANQDLIGASIAIPLLLFFIYSFNKSNNKFWTLASRATSLSDESTYNKTSDKFQLESKKIQWLENELLKLNQEMFDEDRPQNNSNFFQHFPKVLLTKEKLSTKDVEEAVTELVKKTEKRIGKLEVPFRKPRVIFTPNLPENEPGHIEFGEYETIIRIHPDYIENPFSLASILCHELAHFILDRNGLRKENKFDNEKLTDLFIFKCGQGLVYLQGILDITSENGMVTENKLGYLSLEEVAYAHVRCSSQHGLSITDILPKYLTNKVFTKVKKAIEFLTLKKSLQLAEIILCPNNHI